MNFPHKKQVQKILEKFFDLERVEEIWILKIPAINGGNYEYDFFGIERIGDYNFVTKGTVEIDYKKVGFEQVPNQEELEIFRKFVIRKEINFIFKNVGTSSCFNINEFITRRLDRYECCSMIDRYNYDGDNADGNNADY